MVPQKPCAIKSSHECQNFQVTRSSDEPYRTKQLYKIINRLFFQGASFRLHHGTHRRLRKRCHRIRLVLLSPGRSHDILVHSDLLYNLFLGNCKNKSLFFVLQSSPLIFPPGFCERNNLALKPPVSTPGGEEEKFSWYEYLKNTRSQAAPVNLFINREEIKHGFKVGLLFLRLMM